MQSSFTSILLLTSTLALGVVGQQGFFDNRQGINFMEKLQDRRMSDLEFEMAENYQDPLNKMITVVAYNMISYIKQLTQSEESERMTDFEDFRQFEEYSEQLLNSAAILTGIQIQKAKSKVKATSLWEAYNPDTDPNDFSSSIIFDKSSTFRSRLGKDRWSEPMEEAFSDGVSGSTDEEMSQSLFSGSLLAFGACTVCRFNLDLLNRLTQSERFQLQIERFTDDLCFMGRFQLYLNSCKGFSRHFVPGLLDNLSEVVLTADYFCPMMGICEHDPNFELLQAEDYIERVLADKPDYLKNDDFIDNLYKTIDEDDTERKTISIIQFTDIHLDLDYRVGASIQCNNMICCRHEDGYPQNPDNKAGKYGALAQCDIPTSVLFKMGDKINQLAPDALFWTGDITPHDMWNQSMDHVVRYSDYLTNFMKKQLGSWATYVQDGNHDYGMLINSMDFREGRRDPIIDHQAETWKQWFTEESMAEFQRNGFYTQPFKTSDGRVHDKVRVIAINTEACYYYNLFLLTKVSDPGNQLEWLEATLREMQANGEIAILIGHHPPGAADCLSEWAKRLNALLERYQDVIRVSFFGHVHEELFSSVRAWDSLKPIGTNHWTAAVTTFSESYKPAYPSFRRFILDEETMLPVKIETYSMDINQEEPEFVLDHEMSELYDMPNLSPSNFDELSIRLAIHENLAYVFERAKTAFGPNPLLGGICSEKCREHLFCQTSFSVHSDVRACLGKKEEGSFWDDPLLKMATMTSGTWLNT